MFYIKPIDTNTVMAALKTLAWYNVSIQIKATNEDSTKASNFTFIITELEDSDDDIRLAEMAFQMNFHQKCGDDGILIFTHTIERGWL